MKINITCLEELIVGMVTGMMAGMIAGMFVGPPIMKKVERWKRKRKDLKILREMARQRKSTTSEKYSAKPQYNDVFLAKMPT